jgi:diguanylate cyclase (GGDEF)-like protein/PAS domain S-box-containing protein
MSACGFVIRWQWLSMPDSQHLGSPVNDSRRWLSAATTSGSRPSDGALLTRVIAYLQFAGACLAVTWLVVAPVGPVNRPGLIVVALSGAVFAAALSRASGRVHRSWLVAISLISTALLGAYTSFAGEAAAPFSLLYLVAAGVAIWCFSSRQAIVQVGWIATVFALAIWIYRSPGDPPWPRLSGDDPKSLLIWVGAFGAVALLIKLFKRDIVDRDQRLAAVVDSSQDAIFGKDREGLITVWNRAAERLYGYTASEAIGQPVGLLVPPSRVGEDRELLRRVLAGERIERYRTERVCKDGSLVNVSVSVSPILNTDGAVVGASSIARDVTSAMRAQREIALQAELLDEVDAAVIATDTAFVVKYWNQGAEQLYGYSAEDAIGRPVIDLIVPDQSRATVTELGGNALAGRPAEAELDVHDKEGRVFPVYLRLRAAQLDSADAGVTSIISVAVDISARRLADAAIGRHAAQQEEIANLGRLALQGDSLADLFDYAVRIASGILSAQCARVLDRLPDTSGFLIRAGVGWLDGRKGEHVAGEPPSISGFAVAAREPVVVQDWDQERRFERSSRLLARGVRSSVAVPIGDPSSPFGVLEVHYTQPQAVPADCGPFLAALANVLAEAIQRQDARETIRVQALHDGLTGLPNRTLFHDRVTHALARNDQRRKRLAVFLIDIDHFKLVNDSVGHDAGDELLRLLAPRFANAIREGDTLARLGGDQFAVLCEELPSELAAVGIARQLIGSLEQPVVARGEQRVLSASVGIALSSGQSTATELLRDADAAMYHAKKAGGRRFELFDQDMRDRVLGRVRTESALRAALDNEQEIYVHYQPLVSLKTGRIVGAEALARWRHPDWGPVAPIEFIPVAEDSGLIHELGEKVIRRAVRESAAWQHVPDFAGIAVNVSTRQLVESDEVPTLLSDAIVAAGVEPGFVTVEVTESVLIEQLEAAHAALNSLRDLGVHLALDDFGTGYSSLSYLRDLPLDVVKIDRSLIKGIIDTPRAADIPAAIVHMTHSLDLKVVAEGVETIEQAARLQRLNCDIAQGYYFAKPMAPEQLTELLHNQPQWLPPTAKQSRSAQPKTTVRSQNMARGTRPPKSEPLPTARLDNRTAN